MIHHILLLAEGQLKAFPQSDLRCALREARCFVIWEPAAECHLRALADFHISDFVLMKREEERVRHPHGAATGSHSSPLSQSPLLHLL